MKSDAAGYEQILQILVSDWDPLSTGIGGGPDDEYHSQAVVLLEMLDRRAGVEEIANYLARSEEGLLFQPPDLSVCHQAAVKLHALVGD